MYAISNSAKYLYYLKAGLGIIAGIWIAYSSPPGQLQPASMQALGIVIWAIIWWVFEVLPEYVTALLMCTLFVLLDLVPFTTAFNSFSSSTWWLLMASLGLGAAIAHSGLLTRMARSIIRLFPATYRGQVMGLLGVGFLTAPFVPSMNAKVAMLAPLSTTMSDTMGYDKQSQGATGIFTAMYRGVCNMGPVFLTASVNGYLIQGFFPAAIQQKFGLAYWFLCMLPWGIMLTLFTYGGILYLYRPEHPPQVNSPANLPPGPLSRNEKITMLVMGITFLLWATEPWHHLSAVMVALLSLSLLISLDILPRDGFRASIPWDSLVFIGIILNLSLVFAQLGINAWLVSIFYPLIAHFAANIYLFIIVLALITYLVRMIIVSEMAYISIFMVFLMPLAHQAGINPWIVGAIVYCSVNPWIVPYQNAILYTAHYASGGDVVKLNQVSRLSLTYMVGSIVALLVSVPFWHLLGII
ncbi:MAG: SLC13 family permease [Methanomassiliicoccales archaeon]